MLSLFFA